MRKLSKGPKPQVLLDNEEQWKKELMDAIASGDKEEIAKKTKRYGHKDIKDALVAENYGKCAYCEAYVRHVSHGDIEHISPKSKAREKTFDWNNLTLACERCNQKKSDAEGVIDPHVDAPEDHLLFLAAVVRGRTTKGMRSIKPTRGLDLNRTELVERRGAQISRYADSFERIIQEQDEDKRSILVEALQDDLADPKTEYSAMLKALHQVFELNA
ncbi:HNH endonuclease [Leisingera methylohalidivorans]|uniref:HNH nuclease domain-containing protein n=1 Tax=Leisingera methylohalidivorans DSM 14336 TaxID=999552 RepID=V9VW34_9RHOB|nr:HNH endonuclease [Leisingera methylohalidivorans]AHD02961.1 hypothetical protein METH_06965 [Leisingera methylohalidivorans DSM 14336]